MKELVKYNFTALYSYQRLKAKQGSVQNNILFDFYAFICWRKAKK